MPETPSGIFFISYFGSGKKVREFESYYLIRRSFLAIVCIAWVLILYRLHICYGFCTVSLCVLAVGKPKETCINAGHKSDT